jgi:hypothetical protein
MFKLLRWSLAFLAAMFFLGAGALWLAVDKLPSRDLAESLYRRAPWLERLSGGRTLGELLRYAERRLLGHDRLAALAQPGIDLLRRQVERPVSIVAPALGKGQRQDPGDPEPAALAESMVQTAEQLIAALAEARPGRTIELLPGHYRLPRTVETPVAGAPGLPITVRAGRPGQVVLETASTEGFWVTRPYWVFENLTVRGVCAADHDCEHAFHVVGQAHHTTIRNNRIEDFNAHIKVNGSGGDWPDHGLVQHNTLVNHRERRTDRPVTFFDLVGADRWQVADNLVANFVKAGGDRIAYGMFMKGGSRGGRFERNVIVCTPADISRPGLRVGLSFGGGGTDRASCREDCAAEHGNGLAANNVIAHCNDFGIDVNRGRNIVLAHNTLINTSGIDVREAPAVALVYGNLLEGRIRARNGGRAKTEMNEQLPLGAYLRNPDRLDLRWTQAVDRIPSIPAVPADFCGRARPDGTYPGALDGPEGC